MRRHIISFAIFALSWLTMLHAQTLDAPTFIWFDHVNTPTTFNEQQLIQLTAQLHQALKNNTPIQNVIANIKDDPSPRIVFLTIGDDLWPARTYFGTGFSFLDALQKAAQILVENEKAKVDEIIKQANSIIKQAEEDKKQPPKDWIARKANPGQWHWLKLQVVQATKPFQEFTFNRSRFAFTDLVGFAFGPTLGFAFTPDQITGRYLLTDKNFISKKQVGNIIAEAFNFDALSTWLRATSVQQEQRICLFEVDSYFTDGIMTTRLFRGHTLPFVPDAAQCLDSAKRAAKAVAERLTPDTGELIQPFPDWKQPQPDTENLDDLAEFAVAMQLLAKASGNMAHLDTAKRALASVKNAAVSFKENDVTFSAIAELEPLPENSPKQPRTIALLKNNALALIALLEPAQSGDSKAKTLAADLAKFIANLKREDGSFHNARIIPSAQTLDYPEKDTEGRLLDHALACIALKRAGDAFNKQDWVKTAQATLLLLVKDLAAQQPQFLEVLSPWFVEALTSFDAISKPHAQLMPKIGVALLNARAPMPLAPDMAAAPKHYQPALTDAARNTWAVATLANWFHKYKPEYERALMAENALAVAFHIQAQIDLPAASALPRPKFYIDFYRDYLDSFRFTLAGQSAHIIALAKNADVINKYHQGAFPDAQIAREQLAYARKFINLHPAFLNTDTISNHHGISEEARDLQGTFTDKKESKVSPEDANLFRRTQQAPSRR